MNCTLFKFLAKISFSCYLLHFIVITVTTATFHEHLEYTLFSQIQFFIGNFLISIFLATIMTVVIEMPFAKLERILMAKTISEPAHNSNQVILLESEDIKTLENEMIKLFL